MSIGLDILNLLVADGDMNTFLTGGIYDQGQIGEISRQLTPGAFDVNKEVLPCCLIKETGSFNLSGVGQNTESQTIDLFFYQRISYDAIDMARERAFDLLNRQYILPVSPSYPGAVTDTRYYLIHTGDIVRTEDNALNCRLSVSSFSVSVNRRGVTC